MAGRWSGAASDALLPLLHGPVRTGTVVGAGPHAAYLQLDSGEEPGLVAVVAHGAVRVPCAIVLPVAVALPSTLVPRARVQVGQGEVRWDDEVLAVVRWWPAAAVQGTGQHAGLAGRLAALRLARGPHELPESVPEALSQGAHALEAGDAAGAATAVRPVLGLGSGLTPSADDAVAGLLLAARSWHGPELAEVLSSVGTRLARDLSDRTTAVSAGLLRHACEGRGAPEVVQAVEHLSGHAVEADDAVLDRLVRLGHSSGRDTASGVLAVLGRYVDRLSRPSNPLRTAHRPTVRESA